MGDTRHCYHIQGQDERTKGEGGSGFLEGKRGGRHICYSRMGLLRAPSNKQGMAERRERGCWIRSHRTGSVSVLAQIRRECRENWASARSGTPAVSQSVRDTAPLNLPTCSAYPQCCCLAVDSLIKTLCVCVCVSKGTGLYQDRWGGERIKVEEGNPTVISHPHGKCWLS